MTPFQKYSLLTVIVFISLWFYWYQLRPSNIRKICHENAGNRANELLKIKAEMPNVNMYDKEELLDAYNKGLHNRDDYDSIYEKCLHKEGLK